MLEGEERILKRLRQLSDLEIEKGVQQGIAFVQAEAKQLCTVNTGELRESILTKTEKKSAHVEGICYTNKEYAPYIEFGTGPVGQKNHAGISPEVTVTYSQQGWIIPANAMSRAEAEKYGLGVLEGKEGEIIGYTTNGQPAKPFMYPALKNNKDTIIEIIYKEARKGKK